MPDWLTYLQAAEAMHCPPWALFEEGETPPPRRFWMLASLIYTGARNEAQQTVQKRMERNARQK